MNRAVKGGKLGGAKGGKAAAKQMTKAQRSARAKKAAAASATGSEREGKSKEGKMTQCVKATPEYADRLIHDWHLDRQSERFQVRVRSVLTELSADALLFLVGPRLEVMARAKEGVSVWAYFPLYGRRFTARKLKPKPRTRVVLVFDVGIFEKQPPGQSEEDLRDHLGHALLYLRSPGAPNECSDAQREWRSSIRPRATKVT